VGGEGLGGQLQDSTKVIGGALLVWVNLRYKCPNKRAIAETNNTSRVKREKG